MMLINANKAWRHVSGVKHCLIDALCIGNGLGYDMDEKHEIYTLDGSLAFLRLTARAHSSSTSTFAVYCLSHKNDRDTRDLGEDNETAFSMHFDV